jgi:hypothetical protein
MSTTEPFQYRNKGTQSGTEMLLYRTEITDVGMPMPAASASMPIPYTYLGTKAFLKGWKKGLNVSFGQFPCTRRAKPMQIWIHITNKILKASFNL